MTTSSEGEQAVRSLFAEYTAAWTSRNARRCGELFHEEGDLIALDGAVCHGPSEVTAYYERQLNGPYRNLQAQDVAFEPARFLAPNLAVMNAQWKVAGFKDADGVQREPTLTRASFVLTTRQAGWCFAAARFMVPFVTGV